MFDACRRKGLVLSKLPLALHVGLRNCTTSPLSIQRKQDQVFVAPARLAEERESDSMQNTDAYVLDAPQLAY